MKARALIATVGVAAVGSLTLAVGGVIGSGEADVDGGWTDGGEVAVTGGGDAATAARSTTAARKRKRGPVVNHLITSSPIPVPSEGNVFVQVKCSKKQGVPIGGGFMLAAGSELVPAVESRFNPNDFSKPKRSYFIGVRNPGSDTHAFRGTLTCLKGAREKG